MPLSALDGSSIENGIAGHLSINSPFCMFLVAKTPLPAPGIFEGFKQILSDELRDSINTAILAFYALFSILDLISLFML